MSRVVAHNSDLSLPKLGLDEATWDSLCRTVDTVVHVAALVNHVKPYLLLVSARRIVSSLDILLR